MERDPRQSPERGDRLTLLGWRIEVVLVEESEVHYWRGGHRAVGGREMVTQPLADWRETMGKHAEIISTEGGS